MYSLFFKSFLTNILSRHTAEIAVKRKEKKSNKWQSARVIHRGCLRRPDGGCTPGK